MKKVLETIYNSNLPVSQRIEVFKSNEIDICNFNLTQDNEDRLKLYDFIVSIYLKDFKSEEEKIQGLALLRRIETDLRKLDYSEEKMRVLEEFQFNLAHSLFLNGDYKKSRKSFEQLIECRPNNASYRKYWAKNEAKIANHLFNIYLMLIIPGLIASVVFMVIFKGEWPIYLFFTLLLSLVIASFYKVFWKFKSR